MHADGDVLAALYFNPRSPHGERRDIALALMAVQTFQSTLPARGATTEFSNQARHLSISIHAPRTGSDDHQTAAQRIPHISIHAPRTGSDVLHRKQLRTRRAFQSTLPARGATSREWREGTVNRVFQSTLPARGATHWGRWEADCCGHFNPRSPHGERPLEAAKKKLAE